MSVPTDYIKDIDLMLINKKRKLHKHNSNNVGEEKVITFIDEFFSKITPCIKRIRKRILKVSIYNIFVGSIIFTGSIYYNLPVLYSFFGFSLLIMSINGIIIGVK